MTSPATVSSGGISSFPSLTDLDRYLVRAQRTRALHRARNLLYDRLERLYYKQHWDNPPLDEADYQVILPFHTITVNTAHAILTGMRPTVRVYPNNPSSSRDQARADQMERWHLGVDEENTAAMDEDQWDLAVFNQCLFGVGVLREVYNFPKGWISGAHDPYDLPRYPIVQHALDPRQVYWERGNPPRGRFRLVFYDMEASVEDIEAVYGVEVYPRKDDKGNLLPLDYEERRTVVDWWEWRGEKLYHAIFLEVANPHDGEPGGQWIKPPTPMPEYFTLPYHIFPFFETNSQLPHEWGLSVLYALTDIPHWMEIMASRQMRAMELYVDPIVLAERGPNAEGAIEIIKSPGTIVDLMQGDNVRYLQWQGSPPDVQRLWNTMDEIIHELSFSKVLMAQGSSDATGFRTALDRETSLLKISKGLANYQRARARVYAARAYAVGRLSQEVKIPVQGESAEDGHFQVALEGGQVAQYRSVVVEVKPHFSGDLLREINTANQAVASKVWSIDDAMDYVPPPNGRSKKATREAMVQDMLEFHPEVIGAKAKQIAAQIDFKTQEIVQELQGLGEGGMGAGMGLVNGILGEQAPGPGGGVPALPGSPSAPGQPAGANPASPQGAGLNNRLRPMQTGGAGAEGGPAAGTATPGNIVERILGAGAGRGVP